MKALVYEGPRQMPVREVPVPDMQADEVLIKVAYSGICGSELSGFLGQNSLRKPPLVMGHEFSGRVHEVGETAHRLFPALEAGMPVTANPLISCGHCEYCLTGRQQLCPQRKLHSAHLPGSNAEFIAIRADAVIPLPESLALTTAAIAEPVACVIHCAEFLRPRPDETAFVVGAGPLGLLMVEALFDYGVKTVYCADLNSKRLAMAEALGAKPADASDAALRGSSDIVIDAVGAQPTRAASIQLVKAGGKVSFFGLHDAEATLPLNDIIRREIQCSGSFAYSAIDFQKAVDGLAAQRYWLEESWTRVEALEQGANCFEELLGSSSVAKIWLSPNA